MLSYVILALRITKEKKERKKHMLPHPEKQKQLTTFGRKKIYSPKVDIY